MEAIKNIDDSNLDNLINIGSNNSDNVLRKKIRTFYNDSKYKNIFYRENKKIRNYLNHKYGVAICIEELDKSLYHIFDVIITEIASDNNTEIYQINKSNGLTITQLALLCDNNNLEFGYDYIKEKNYIVINKNPLEY